MIISKTFGGVVLSGEDASKFERQIKRGRANPRAQEALKRGDELLRQFGDGKAGDEASRPEMSA